MCLGVSPHCPRVGFEEPATTCTEGQRGAQPPLPTYGITHPNQSIGAGATATSCPPAARSMRQSMTSPRASGPARQAGLQQNHLPPRCSENAEGAMGGTHMKEAMKGIPTDSHAVRNTRVHPLKTSTQHLAIKAQVCPPGGPLKTRGRRPLHRVAASGAAPAANAPAPVFGPCPPCRAATAACSMP